MQGFAVRKSGYGGGQRARVEWRVFADLLATEKIVSNAKHDLGPDGLEGPLLGFFDPLQSDGSQYVSEDFSFCERWVKLCGGEVIALFPQVPGTNDPYTCSAYVHMGQHTNADPVLVIRQTKRARLCEQDVKDLKRELEHYGAPECPYRLDVRQKYLYSHQKSREAELKRQRKEWQAEGQANGK
jgi:hypothetical protein